MRTLVGQRIVVTRAVHQAEELAAPLRELGADVICLPTIAILPPRDTRPLEIAASRIGQYDWIVLSSTNAVSALASYLGEQTPPSKTFVAAVGAATREAAERLGWRIDLVPDEFVAESLVLAMTRESLRGKRILIPSAAVTREVVPRALREAGAVVDVVEAYRSDVPAGLESEARQIFATPQKPDWLTVSSSSAVENLVKSIGTEPLDGVLIASIGPITSEAVRKQGLTVHVEPAKHTIPSLVEAIVNALY
jgi:uroporphyrinogen-III synthase